MSDFPPGFRGRDRYGHYVVLTVDGDDRLVRYDDGREARRPLALLRLAHANREQFDQFAPTAPAAAPAPKKPASRARPPQPQTTWSQEDTEPVIARLIRELAGDPPETIPHEAIVTALLADPAGRRLIARARELQGDNRPPPAIAANMVAWFSQRITVRNSPYARDFERQKLDGAWAYRPRK